MHHCKPLGSKSEERLKSKGIDNLEEAQTKASPERFQSNAKCQTGMPTEHGSGHSSS